VPLDFDVDFYITYCYIFLYCENLFPACGGRRSVVTCTMCMNGVVHVHLPTVRMLLCQVLQVDCGPVRGFLNSFNAVTCGVVVLSCVV